MNWSEAIKAMAEGKKVRAKHWEAYIYISQDNSTSEGAYRWSQLTKFDWEIYEEPGSYEDALKAIMRETEEKLKALHARESEQ